MRVESYRQGFQVRRPSNNHLEGSFLNEAYADLIRAKYITEVLGKHLGFTDDTRKFRDWDYGEFRYTLPNKYTYKLGETWATMLSAYAAFGMELLAGESPGLLEKMEAAHKLPIEIKTFARALNEIQPGLYATLRALTASPEDLSRGLKIIIDALNKKDEMVAASGLEPLTSGL